MENQFWNLTVNKEFVCVSPRGYKDKLGNLLIADQSNDRVCIVFNDSIFEEGESRISLGSFGTPEVMHHPLDVALDPEGNVWVSSAGTHSIQLWG